MTELRRDPTPFQAGDAALVRRGDDPAMVTLGSAAAADAGDFATAMQGQAADSALQPGAQIPWDDVTGKPEFAPVATSGAYGDLSGLPTLFDGEYASLSGIPSEFPPAAHSHAISDVTGLQGALDERPTGDGIDAIVAITQSAYDALDPPDAETLYVITDAE